MATVCGQKVGRVRADSGFDTESILNTLESRELNYVMAVCCYPSIKGRIYGLKNWVEVCHGIEVSEFTHQPHQSAQKGSQARSKRRSPHGATFSPKAVISAISSVLR